MVFPSLLKPAEIILLLEVISRKRSVSSEEPGNSYWKLPGTQAVCVCGGELGGGDGVAGLAVLTALTVNWGNAFLVQRLLSPGCLPDPMPTAASGMCRHPVFFLPGTFDGCSVFEP